MATRARKGGGSPASSQTPIKGALAKEGEGSESSALLMVMQRLEAIQNEQMVQAKAIERMLTATSENLNRVQQEVQAELKAERIRSQTSFDNLAAQFQKLAESKPDDPETQAQIIKAELQRAKKALAARKEQFKEMLREMPRGQVISHEREPVTVGINGHYVIIRPGVNDNIPASFIEEWERRQRVNDWAKKVAYSLEVKNEEIPDANKIGSIVGGGPIWDENKGVVG